MTPPERSIAEFWPIFGLRLATPRLTLIPLQDQDLVETIDLILDGIHDPAGCRSRCRGRDAPREELVQNSLRYYWSARAAATPEEWRVPFVVRRAGRIVGLQDLMGKNFAVTRTVSTGSWLGGVHQGSGLGTEMREAVLQFAFDHLKAERADSGAFVDNPQSLRVSEKLGYPRDGTAVMQRRPGERAVEQRLTVNPGEFRRSTWAVQVRGLPACRSFFGL